MNPRHGHIQHLTESEGYEILRQNSYGHIGYNDDEQVNILPINYLFLDGKIYCHSREGGKIQAMRKRPHVCLQVEEVVNLFKWKSAVAWGTFFECDDYEASQTMRIFLEKMSTPNESLGKSSLEEDFSAIFERAIIFKIEISRVTACSENSELTRQSTI